jgi:hypothetical protein
LSINITSNTNIKKDHAPDSNQDNQIDTSISDQLFIAMCDRGTRIDDPGHVDVSSVKEYYPSYHYNNYTNKEQQATPWTNAKIVNDLSFLLCTVFSAVIDEKTGEILITHRYYDQAEKILYRIPVWKSPPPFLIELFDLTKKIKRELRDLKKSNRRIFESVVKEAVGILFENINSKYYHLSVARHLRVKFVRGETNEFFC